MTPRTEHRARQMALQKQQNNRKGSTYHEQKKNLPYVQDPISKTPKPPFHQTLMFLFSPTNELNHTLIKQVLNL